MKESLKMEIDWEVNREELTIRGAKTNRFALTRTDTGEILSVCSGIYEPFYNKDLIQLVERIESQSNFTCIGFEQFQKGKRILAFLKDNKSTRLVNDASEHYLIIGNSHDQSSKIFLGLSNFMFRCENQFSRELYDLRIKHTHRLDLTDRDISELIFNYEAGKKKQLYLSSRLSKWEVSEEEIQEFLKFMYPDPPVTKEKVQKDHESLERSRNRRREMMESIHREMKDLGRNAWGMFNGVTFHTSNRMRNRNAGFGNTNGTAQQLNARAWEYCTKLINEQP
jgi:hypothetical protein